MKRALKNTFVLLKYVRTYSPSYIWIVLLVALTAFVGPYSTVFVPKTIMDMLIKGTGIGSIVWMIGTMVIANMLRILALTVFEERYKPYQQMQIEKGMNALLIEKSKLIDMRQYEDPKFRDVYDRAISHANNGMRSFLEAITNLADRFLYLVSVITIITSLDPFLILFSISCVCILFFFQTRIASYAYHTDVMTTRDSRRAEYAKKICYGMEYSSDVKILRLGDIFKKEYLNASEQKQQTLRKRSRSKSFLRISDEILRLLILNMATMIYLVIRIQRGHLAVSSFVVLITAVMQLSYELFSFVNSLNAFYKLSIYTEDLVQVLDCKSDIEDGHSEDTIADVDSIVLEGVSFAYPQKDQLVLDAVDMQIQKGQHIAIAGHNGAGKTTLVRLLLRLYDVNHGKVYVNGKKLQTINITSWRNHIGVVFQDYHYYAMTIAENVLMRKVNGDEDRALVREALEKADLWRFVAQLPETMDTMLTREFDREGINLSGGQSQKLALARVFAQKDKQILIMDEVSAALDPDSESYINRRILEFCQDKILIFITHRLSLMKEMDQIFYFDNGHVKERGTHEQLLDCKGSYYEMFMKQADHYISRKTVESENDVL